MNNKYLIYFLLAILALCSSFPTNVFAIRPVCKANIEFLDGNMPAIENAKLCWHFKKFNGSLYTNCTNDDLSTLNRDITVPCKELAFSIKKDNEIIAITTQYSGIVLQNNDNISVELSEKAELPPLPQAGERELSELIPSTYLSNGTVITGLSSKEAILAFDFDKKTHYQHWRHYLYNDAVLKINITGFKLKYSDFLVLEDYLSSPSQTEDMGAFSVYNNSDAWDPRNAWGQAGFVMNIPENASLHSLCGIMGANNYYFAGEDNIKMDDILDEFRAGIFRKEDYIPFQDPNTFTPPLVAHYPMSDFNTLYETTSVNPRINVPTNVHWGSTGDTGNSGQNTAFQDLFHICLSSNHQYDENGLDFQFDDGAGNITNNFPAGEYVFLVKTANNPAEEGMLFLNTTSMTGIQSYYCLGTGTGTTGECFEFPNINNATFALKLTFEVMKTIGNFNAPMLIKNSLKAIRSF